MKLNWKTMGQREKDAAVAEKVMGWKLWVESGDPMDDTWETGDPLSPTHKWFNPTTDPADCALVKERFPMWRVNRWSETLYEAQIGEFTAEARTECEAFCLAALRANGMEVEV